MAITGIDDLVNALGNASQQVVINKSSLGNATAGQPMSLWRATGTPGQGAIPTTAALCTSALTGCFPFTNPGSGLVAYIARMMLMSANSATDIQVHDRLAHMGGLNGTLTTAQTAGVDVTGTSSNINVRRGGDDYSDVQWWLEIYTDVGTTNVTATITYTNAAGTTGRTTTALIGSTSNSQNRIGRMIPIIGNGGEYIQSVQSVQLSATTGSAGNFGVTATRALCGLSLGLANSSEIGDWAQLGLPRVADDACLMLVCFPGATTTGALYGSAKIVSG